MTSKEALWNALRLLPGYDHLPENSYPTLPTLEVVYGQQHFITTFCLAVPPPALLAPPGTSQPAAVTLHTVFPEGYAYWQPETGTSHYVRGVPHPDELPPTYGQLLAERIAQLTFRPTGTYPTAPLSQYLRLLDEVAVSGWLLGRNADPAREKAVARQLQQLLAQLCEPELAAYYLTRGQALRRWLDRATYEKNWVELALEAVAATMPAWVTPPAEEDSPPEMAAPLPAVLDNRPCVVVGFYRTTAPAGQAEEVRVHPPFAACYVAYSDLEVRWRALSETDAVGFATLLRDEQGRGYLGAKSLAALPAGENPPALRAYQQAVAQLLERGWLTTRHRPTATEQTIARALGQGADALFAGPLGAYYRHTAWQLLGWQRRVLGSELTADSY